MRREAESNEDKKHTITVYARMRTRARGNIFPLAFVGHRAGLKLCPAIAREHRRSTLGFAECAAFEIR